MEAYLPLELWRAWVIAGMLLAVLVLGFALTYAPLWLGRVGSWGLVALGFLGAHLVCAQEMAGFRMLAIIGVVLFAMKAVVAVEARHAGGPRLGPLAWFAWASAWPGMDPSLFAHPGRSAAPEPPADHRDRRSAVSFLLRGAVRLAIGAGLLVAAHLVWGATHSYVLATILALPGVSLVLHFGLFNLAAGFWRALGVPTYTLFPAPLTSTSLGEFWGRRWNLPFTEMIQRAVYRPLSPVLGRQVAASVGFFCSGLLHECAISVSVMEGFGWPMLYFVLHGLLVVAERSTRLGAWLAAHPWSGRAWTLLWLALPMPILFHPPFLKGVVWPLVGVPATP